MDASDPYKTKTFEASYGTEVEVSLNFTRAERAGDNLIYLGLSKKDNSRRDYNTSLTRENAAALRDHLTLLLGDQPETAPAVVSPDAVKAMEALAHQMDVFYTSELVDALNEHTTALNNFNK